MDVKYRHTYRRPHKALRRRPCSSCPLSSFRNSFCAGSSCRVPSCPPSCIGISYLVPMSYAVDATQQLSTHAAVTAQFVVDVIVVAGFLAAALALGATTLRRRTP